MKWKLTVGLICIPLMTSGIEHLFMCLLAICIFSLNIVYFKCLFRSFGEGNSIPLQYSCLENPMDGGAWKAAVQGVTEGRTRLSDFTFTFHFHALEKEMATHSTVLAWRIPGTGEPSGLPSMGSHRVGHDWSDLVAAAAAPELQADSLLSESPCYFSHVFYPPCTSPNLITIPEFPLPGGA